MANSEGIEQRSLDWYRVRMGYFSASQVGELMVKGRSKDAVFGQSALSYIYQIAGERDFNPNLLENDFTFETYVEQTNVTTKAMEWGTEWENVARTEYAKKYGAEVCEAGSFIHKHIPYFSASPDGIINLADGNKAGLEIKCPVIKTYKMYQNEINDAEGLKKVKPVYYWQVIAQMMCCGFEYVDWMAYQPWLSHPIHVVRIMPDEDAFKELGERVLLANEYINKINQE